MQDIYQGKANKENQAIADMMRYDQSNSLTPDAAAQEAPQEADINAQQTA